MQVDYVSAFCQAPIKEDVYVDMLRGWQMFNQIGITENHKKNHVLKLNRSLYGLHQLPRNFFLYPKGNLEAVGFSQSQLDPCLFILGHVICVFYVDNCLFFAARKSNIEKVVKAIKEERKMDLIVEDSDCGFLGISMNKRKGNDGCQEIQLLQTGLIDRVIVALGLDEHSNGMSTPACEKILPKHAHGDPHDLGFNYASVVGMAMCLCNNCRPDSSFAVHQYARHSFDPKRQHTEYLKRIGQYLISTRNKGLILRPREDNIFQVDCYVDADFAGMWNSEEDQDPHCVKSR